MPRAPLIPYRLAMIDEDDDPAGLTGWLRARLHLIIGIAGLLAWFAMLWLMFGDVL